MTSSAATRSKVSWVGVGWGSFIAPRIRPCPAATHSRSSALEYSNDPQFRARFEREATVASTLGHPNIVAVYSRGETEGGQLWIAMQYVAGTDADRELLRRQNDS